MIHTIANITKVDIGIGNAFDFRACIIFECIPGEEKEWYLPIDGEVAIKKLELLSKMVGNRILEGKQVGVVVTKNRLFAFGRLKTNEFYMFNGDNNARTYEEIVKLQVF